MKIEYHVSGSVQDCSISNVLAMEILQCCTKPLILSLSKMPYLIEVPYKYMSFFIVPNKSALFKHI